MRGGNEEKTVGTSSVSNGSGSLSLPLYAGGLGVTLCGVQAVTSSMNTPEITTVATLLTLLGFGFSLACRRLRVQPRVIEVVCLILFVVGVYLAASQRLDLRWFMNGADKTEDRIAACLMWSAVLWSWTLISDDNVMFTCVLSAAMIGLTGTSNVNTPIIVFFCLFMLAMLFLLIHHHYLQSRSVLPTPRAETGSLPIVLGIQGMLAVLCAVGVLGLAALVVVPAQAVFADLSLAQAVRQLVNAGKADVPAPLVATQFFDDVALSVGRGSVWPTGTDTIMRVSASDGLPHYWRGRTYDVYAGDGWQSSLSLPVPLKAVSSGERGQRFPILGSAFSNTYAPTIVGETSVPLPAPLAPRAPLLQAVVEVRGATNEFYYCDQPRDLLFDTGGGAVPRLSPDGCLDLEEVPVRSPYKVFCDPAPNVNDLPVQIRLRRAGTQYPSVVRKLYLNVMSRTDNSITTADDALYFQDLLKDIFASLPPARRTPLDKAVAIRNWVASNCTYSLSVAPLPDDMDHVRAFLDGSRTGHCDLFASAVVVLCRTAGIPARMATGFAPGEQDGTVFNLRAMDKHAWAEAYFPGASWVILDATVGSSADASVPTGRTEDIGTIHMLWQNLTQSGPVPVVLMFVIVGLLVWIAKNELWDKRTRRPAATAAVRASYRARTAAGQQWMEMTRELGRLGMPRRPSETPAEFAARARAFFGEQQMVTGVALPFGAIDTLTGQFSLSRYAPAVESESASAASDALSEVSAAARRARRALLWHRLRRAFGAG